MFYGIFWLNLAIRYSSTVIFVTCSTGASSPCGSLSFPPLNIPRLPVLRILQTVYSLSLYLTGHKKEERSPRSFLKQPEAFESLGISSALLHSFARGVRNVLLSFWRSVPDTQQPSAILKLKLSPGQHSASLLFTIHPLQ